MKITKFPKANLDAVLVSCAKLKKAFDSLSDKNRQLSKLLAHQSKLEREIATIHDDPKPGNVEQAKSLGAATADLEITKKAIGKIQIPQHLLDLLGNETRTTAHQASLCLRPTHEAYTAKVAEDLREWCADALNAVPAHLDPAAVESYLRALPGVTDVHDLHIWGMSTTDVALTAHIIRPEVSDDDALLRDAASTLHSRFGISHPTLQIERGHGPDDCHLAPANVI